jgi:hypothetical protein
MKNNDYKSKAFTDGFLSGLAAPMFFLGMNAELPKISNGASVKDAWARVGSGMNQAYKRDWQRYEQRNNKSNEA